MRIVKVVYDDESDYIMDIVLNISQIKYLEAYNISDYRQKKKALPIMTRNGTKNVPLVVFEDENLQEVSAIWSEQNPDWKTEIIKKLTNNEN